MTDFSDKIYLLDGAMGTMIQRYGLKGSTEKFNLTHPELIKRIHKEYIEAGADIIETNSFSAGYKEALAGARIAREAADESGRKVYVAGSLGPRSKSLSTGTDADNPAARETDFDSMAAEYRESIRGLVEGGVDLILLETCFDALNVKAALAALSSLGSTLPIMISASCADKSGRLLTGQTLEAFYRSVEHCNPISFGLNCSLGGEQMIPLIREVSSFASCAVSCYPNAGLPNEMGGYDQTPQQCAQAIRYMASEGLVNIVGGCCGTTPEHIKAISEAVKGLTSREIPKKEKGSLFVSGLESVRINLEKNNFTNIGERTNVAGSRKFARLIASGNYQEALEIAARQVADGADIIDINMDDAMLKPSEEMETFVRYIQSDPSVSKAALMIDSSHFEAILAGLKNAQGKCIVNSLSLKEGEEEFLKKAAIVRRMGASLVVMAFDENGQASSYERKIQICQRAYNLLLGIGFRPEDIIFDVNVLTIGTGIDSDRKYAVDFIEAVRWIKQNLPGAKTSGGISNLSFSFRGNNPVREAMHSVFLYHAIQAGLDMAIVNPGMLQIYDEINPDLRQAAEDLILDRADNALGRLSMAAERMTDKSDVKEEGEKESLTLSDLLVKGCSEGLEEKVLEQYRLLGSARKVIEGPLMEGMEKVGEMFSNGKMFLPQVVKSSRTMKLAVEMLNPFMQETGGEIKGKGKILIATVKGDVHDIGKNITATVLRCNGFIVNDLGVMVDKETILEQAESFKPDIIGVSGLITPSLEQMENLCKAMSEKRMDTPLFIGGATTSELHTAVKLAKEYSHVYYGADASSTAVMALKYMADRRGFEIQERKRQEEIRSLYALRKDKPGVARVCADDDCAGMDMASSWEIPVGEIPKDELESFIDWGSFLGIWGFKAKDRESESARRFLEEARYQFSRMSIRIMAGVHVVMAGEFGHKEMPLWTYLREDSPLGIFAASVHTKPHRKGCNCAICSGKGDSLLEKTIRLCVAEAASEWIGHRIKPVDGYSIIRPAVGYPSCPEHSLKKEVLNMIPQSSELGIKLTESFAMIPDASVCGFIIMNKIAKYL